MNPEILCGRSLVCHSLLFLHQLSTFSGVPQANQIAPLVSLDAIQVVLPDKSCYMYLKTYLPQRWQLALYTTKLYFLHFYICYHKTKTHRPIALQSVYLTINNAKFT